MRYFLLVCAAIVVGLAGVVGPTAQVSYAAFHCMRIHAVKAGFGGNPNVQYVELRMDAFGQPFVGTHTIEFRDGSGTLKATFTFPANVTNSATGDSILIATSEFNAAAQGGAADFVFSNANTVGANGGDPLHPVQSPNGKVTFAPPSANCNLTTPVDSVAMGAVSGAAAPDYGSPAVALPGPSDNRALRLSNLNTAPADNSAEYSLQAVSGTTFSVALANLPTDFSTPRNNGRTVLKLAAPVAPSVGGIAELPDIAAAPGTHLGSGGPSRAPWYAGGAAAAVLLTGAGGLTWAVRRRRART